MPPYESVGPHQPKNEFFTHNLSKTNQEAAHDSFAHLYDKTDEFVYCSAIQLSRPRTSASLYSGICSL